MAKKQYRYYISQNLIQMRDHPDGLLGRLPAHEIEATVESVLRHSLCSRSSVVEFLGICLDRDIESVQKIVEGQALLQMSRFVQGIIQRITVQAESLEIEVNVQELCTALSQATETKISSPKETTLIVGAFNTRRAKKGAVVIEPEKPDRDIFDLPPDQLKKLMQGFIWRDEHFQGLTIRQIAEREGLSDSYVGKQITYEPKFREKKFVRDSPVRRRVIKTFLGQNSVARKKSQLRKIGDSSPKFSFSVRDGKNGQQKARYLRALSSFFPLISMTCD